ncbi:MAG: hypothetical protein ABJI69_03355 [Balneola sp.]
MKILLTIIAIFLVTGLQQKQEKEPRFKIIAKYVVLDEELSPSHYNCQDEVKEFLKMDKLDCSFLVDKQEFDILEKFVLDNNGQLKEYWNYKPMGPLTYELKDLRADQKFSDMIGVEKIKINSSPEQVFDSGDTLEIEKIYHKEKLIFVERTSELRKKNLRLIFEFK